MRFKFLRSAVCDGSHAGYAFQSKSVTLNYGADIGCSHVGFEPSRAVTGEASPR